MTVNKSLLEIEKYYESKLTQYGGTYGGVDWSSGESQILRFAQLLKIIPSLNVSFSICDYGCGYGALYDYLSAHCKSFKYLGLDISDEMISKAISINSEKSGIARFQKSAEPNSVNDYTIASGIFNVKLGSSAEEWKSYMFECLTKMDVFSQKGFSFNLLSIYSDPDKRRDRLFYADPCEIFVYCKKNFSHNVALLHDYNLFEFTILVKK